jgi:hypothetical protein
VAATNRPQVGGLGVRVQRIGEQRRRGHVWSRAARRCSERRSSDTARRA